MTVPKNPPRSTYLWHHEIHSRIGNEQLLFVLAGFDPVYKRERVIEQTKRALTDLGIRSYALWELIGDHDMMIQAWLPAGVHTDEFLTTLGERVSVEVDTTPMVVESFIDHWMWKGKDLDLDVAESSVNPADYSLLNEGFVPSARLNNYRDAGYIHATPKTTRLKFFVRITNPHKSTSRQVENQIRENIRKVFDDGIFSNGVVMKVHGGASYLITGRLATRHFTAIGDFFQPTFAASGVLESLRCRTITHLSSLYTPLERVEQLLPLPASDATQKPSDEDLQTWLRENESDDLEFKASAFTDVDHKVGRKPRPRSRTEQVHEIAKAVVGLLNAAGGTVIVGVAELDKYSKEELLRAYSDTMQIKDRIVIGVDSEFNRGGWDAYQRSLATGLRNAIDGDIDGWVKYHDLPVGERTVCVIRVRRPPKWFYVKSTDKNGAVSNEFYGRTGGETRALRGQMMDTFKEAHPRTTKANS